MSTYTCSACGVTFRWGWGWHFCPVRRAQSAESQYFPPRQATT